MPPAKKSTSRAAGSRTSASRATRSRKTGTRATRTRTSSSRNSHARFKEPAALKRLTKSLESASAALADLQKQGGRDVGKSAKDLYKDLRTVVTSARRHSGRLGTALQRDFEQAQKRVSSKRTSARTTSARTSRAKSATSARRRPASRTRRSTTRSTARSKSR